MASLYLYCIFLCLCVYHGSFAINLEFNWSTGKIHKKNYNIDENELWIDENNNGRIEISSDEEVSYAWCNNSEKSFNFIVPTGYVSYRHNIIKDIKGNDCYEGQWNCTLLYKKNIPYAFVEDKSKIYHHTDNNNYTYIQFDIDISVKRSVSMFVFDDNGQPLNNATAIKQANTGDDVYVYYKPKQQFVIHCKKNNESKSYLSSGTLELHNCYSPGHQCNANEQDKNVSAVTLYTKNNAKPVYIENSRCTFTSDKGIESTARVIFTPAESEAVMTQLPIVPESGDGVIDSPMVSRKAEICWKYRNSDLSNLAGSLNIEYSTVDKYKPYTCGNQLNLTENSYNTIIISSESQYVYKARCFHNGSEPFITIQQNVKQIGHNMMALYATVQKGGDWDCIFLIEQNVRNMSHPGRCYDTDDKLHYLRIDCIFKVVIASTSQPIFTSTEAGTNAVTETLPAADTSYTATSTQNPRGAKKFTNKNGQNQPKPSITKRKSPKMTSSTPDKNPNTSSKITPKITPRISPINQSDVFTVTPQRAHLNDSISVFCKANQDDGLDNKKFVITVESEDITKTGVIYENNTKFHTTLVMKWTKNVTVGCKVVAGENKVGQELYKEIMYEKEETGADTNYDEEETDQYDWLSKPIVRYGLLGGGVVIIALLLVAICKVYRKPKDCPVKDTTSVEYENLSNETRRPLPPFPRGALLEETYLSPADCQESPYAVSRTPREETYATPFVPKLEDLYSLPLKKKDRTDPSTLYAQVLPKTKKPTELVYADIQFNQANGTNRQYTNADCTYAEVARNCDNSATAKDRDDYTNVFTNEQYCNSKQKSEDYAEPAYCQINRR